MGRKAAQREDGRGDHCGQRIIKRMALSVTSAGQCPYLDISIGFTYGLVSQYNVFPHLRHEVPQGRIQNLITMQIKPAGILGCSFLTSPSPNPSFLCLKITSVSTLPLEVRIYLPEALLVLCRWVYSLNSLNSYKSTP